MAGPLAGFWILLLLGGLVALIAGIVLGTANFFFNMNWLPQAPQWTVPALTIGGLFAVWVASSML